MSDLNKKVSFETGEKESRKEDDGENIDIGMIYENCSLGGRTAPKSQDTTTDNHQQSISTSVSLSPVKRNLLAAAAVLVGLLCLILLVTNLAVLVIQDKNNWNHLWKDNAQLTSERDKLQSSYSEMKSINQNLTRTISQLEEERHELQKQIVMTNNNCTVARNQLWVENGNLSSERDKLQTTYSEMKSINQNLTRMISQLEKEKNLMKDINSNLTTERHELQKQIETSCCPADWIKYRKSCYFISPKRENWSDSKRFCEDQGAHLVIISNTEEQKFISSFDLSVWIGLTDEETEGVWKWVDGTQVTKTYWRINQPDNHDPGEDCVEILRDVYPNNWNDVPCMWKRLFICEINL